ncbi:MAG: DUF1292 domain-containing protein [Clostridiales bacterium]|nr:DUF1292 domain-containing protein [Clostridiales bacterium]
MAEDRSPVELLLDEKNNDNIKLYDEKNECVEFEQIATIPMDERIFVILKPVTAMENVAEDEAIVFEIQEIDEEDCLVVVTEDKIIDKVFDEYYEMLKSEGIDVE